MGVRATGVECWRTYSRRGVHKIHGLKIDEVRARVFGNAAVVTGRTRGVGEFDALVMTL